MWKKVLVAMMMTAFTACPVYAEMWVAFVPSRTPCVEYKDGCSGMYAIGRGFGSKQAALAEASAECKRRNGLLGGKLSRTEAWAKNCMPVTKGDGMSVGNYFPGYGNSRSESEMSEIEECRKRSFNNCRIVETHCSR